LIGDELQYSPIQRDAQSSYQLLTHLVVPRPIAWITTVNAAGLVNLAPFSFYNLMSTAPPVVVFSPTLKADGSKKDTLNNLVFLGECVIHVSTEDLAQRINLTAKALPPDESEVILAELHTVPSTVVTPPRIVEAAAAMECVVRQIIPLGALPGAGNLVIAEIVMVHIRDELLGVDGNIDPQLLRAVGRLGGDNWCKITETFPMKRPV